MNKVYAVSACLVGKNTKYNGLNNKNDNIINFLKDKKYILICPEVTGGLSTPRSPSERINNKVINKDGIDVTKEFFDGAKKELNRLKENNVTTIILKSNSPSCGYGKIYDGTFNNKLINGNGVFVELALKQDNYEILTEDDFK